MIVWTTIHVSIYRSIWFFLTVVYYSIAWICSYFVTSLLMQHWSCLLLLLVQLCCKEYLLCMFLSGGLVFIRASLRSRADWQFQLLHLWIHHRQTLLLPCCSQPVTGHNAVTVTAIPFWCMIPRLCGLGNSILVWPKFFLSELFSGVRVFLPNLFFPLSFQRDYIFVIVWRAFSLLLHCPLFFTGVSLNQSPACLILTCFSEDQNWSTSWQPQQIFL